MYVAGCSFVFFGPHVIVLGSQGKGDFSMEYKAHVPVAQHLQEELIDELRTQRAEREGS